MQNDRSLDVVKYPAPQAAQSTAVFQVMPATDTLSVGPIESLEEPAAPAYTPAKRQVNIRVILLSLGVAVALLILAGFLLAFHDKSASQVKVGEFGDVSLPLGTVASSELRVGSAKTLKINGKLQVSNSVILTPSSTPSNPTAGQLYYDKTANQLAYYNGQQFLPVGGGTATTNTTNTNTTNVFNTLGVIPSGVLLQSSSPGSQQSGNFNISGTGQVGLLKTSVISSDGGTFYLNPVSSADQQTVAPGTPATVGLKSGTTTTGTGWANDLSATKVTMGSVGGTTQSIAAYFAGGTAGKHVQVSLYDDDGDVPSRPSNLLAQSAVVALTPNDFTTVAIPSVNLAANTTYWLAVNTDDTTVMRTYNGGSKSSCFASHSFGFMPAPFGGCFFDDNVYSIYLNYLTGSAGSGSVSAAQLALSATGQAVFQNASDSTNAFQVQNASGTSTLFDVDTLNGRVGIGKSTPGYRLDIAGGDINVSNGHSFRFGGVQALSSNADGSTISITNLNSGGTLSAQADTFIVQDGNATHHRLTIDNTGAAAFSNSSDSTTGFQVQNALGSSILTVDTVGKVVTVTALATTGNLTVGGHIISSGSAPTIVAGAAACTAPTVNVTGNDSAGTITITTGAGCAGGGRLATITFAAAFGAIPHATLTAGNGNAQTLGAYTDNSAATTAHFTLDTATGAANTTSYVWNYLVVQ
jgi:hypothetical protein